MLKVLIIDDDQSILESIKFVLELENFEVLTASNVDEAMSIFSTEYKYIDAVVSDMRMPKFSGMDTIKMIKELSPETGVIILTGHGDMENAIQAMKTGAFEYLRKPILDYNDLLVAINNAADRRKLLLENSRMNHEIVEQNNYMKGLQDSAQKILLNMVPKELPETSGFTFSSQYESCETVGGDMYGLFDMDDYVSFYVTDVSSHGILASLIAVIIKSFMQSMVHSYKSGVKIDFSESISELNNELCKNTAANVFATMFVGFIEKSTKKLCYISAGHIPQYILRGEEKIPLDSTSTVLGFFEGISFPSFEIMLNSKDRVLLFTDGITEASNKKMQFGVDGIFKVMDECRDNSLDMALEELMGEASEFPHENIQDDMTILGIEVS